MKTKINPNQICRCKICGAKIVWLQRKRRGTFYPVEYYGSFVINPEDFHDCHTREFKELDPGLFYTNEQAREEMKKLGFPIKVGKHA